MPSTAEPLSHYTVPMNRGMKEKLKIVAIKQGTTGPAIVRNLINDYLEKSA